MCRTPRDAQARVMTSTPLPGSDSTPRPPLQRSRTDLMLGGVSSGLAAHTGVDALLWRVAFVALTLAGGAGIPIYLVLWVLMPPAPPAPTTGTTRSARGAGGR